MLLCFLQSMLKMVLLLRLNVNHALEKIVAKKRDGSLIIALLFQHFYDATIPLPSLGPFTEKPKAGRSNSGVALLVLAEGKDQLPWPAGSGLPNAAQDALGLSLCDCLTVCLLFIWTIRSFPAKLLPC